MGDLARSALYDTERGSDSCGVGFIVRKDGKQTHELLRLVDEALCAVPHRGGMSSQGVGDGAGVAIDLSVALYRKLTGLGGLEARRFGVLNYFLPTDKDRHTQAEDVVEAIFETHGLKQVLVRDVPTQPNVLNTPAWALQYPIRQRVFLPSDDAISTDDFETAINVALLFLEQRSYSDNALYGFYPLSFSSRTQVLKGRLNSHELVPYFSDLTDADHAIHSVFFHTRFSTNTDPNPMMAQPFRRMAHNGELNTDKKNRLSELAIARARGRVLAQPPGQSDSCHFDQTLQSRTADDGFDLVDAVVAMMPPAWENDHTLDQSVRDMLAYFSLFEEKNDGPAALIFGDGDVIGARLDRLGLRPLRTEETNDYLCVMSEAGQIAFQPQDVLRRGRIEAGGILYWDHREGRAFDTADTLARIAAKRDYTTKLAQSQVAIEDLAAGSETIEKMDYAGGLSNHQRYVAYAKNQESFKFLMDPMLQTGSEKVSAMGYGMSINALSNQEGGVSKYFSQRFAQVTNPPLDSIREADGMTLRVALGAKPNITTSLHRQIVIPSPVLCAQQFGVLRAQQVAPIASFSAVYEPVYDSADKQAACLEAAIEALCDNVERFASEHGGIAIISDFDISADRAALPMAIAVSAVNQRLIEAGLRLNVSLVMESGQVSSAHHIAVLLGFGASCVYPLTVQMRAEEKFRDNPAVAYSRFVKAAEKSLMKTMGKLGLCTAESYIGGEFFEPNFIDTDGEVLRRYFPNLHSPAGGADFEAIAAASAAWHHRAQSVGGEADIPLLGLFKERTEGGGHSYGTAAVRGFVDMTEEAVAFADDTNRDEREGADEDTLRLFHLERLGDAFGLNHGSYSNTSFDSLEPEYIDTATMTPGYRAFIRMLAAERSRRPAALRDVLVLPPDVSQAKTATDFYSALGLIEIRPGHPIVVRGLSCHASDGGLFSLKLTGTRKSLLGRLSELGQYLVNRFGPEIEGNWLSGASLMIRAQGTAQLFLSLMREAEAKLPLRAVQNPSDIATHFASGAMSHGALNAPAHEAVAHGINMIGGLSNSGEGGESLKRFGTIRASRIKQFASGRFGVWVGYLADPMLKELEIKIGQGAKPGEGGQLPAQKVTVEIAAARGGTPGVELISPPPHHDTYSIEDLAQLIHDCKAARVRVIVKLVSSEGIGTIAVGVAKAGADVINVAGNTGGTGAAAVTSLKYTGRAAELGIAEVHQALCFNGLREKVTLRCSGAHQTGTDVVKSALLGGDSFEFGTTALMMLKCVMAKNCNVKCPAGLTTNSELFDGDPRQLAQYFINVALEARDVLANLGLASLRDARGRTDLLHLLEHPATVGQIDVSKMLAVADEFRVDRPIYVAADYNRDERQWSQVRDVLGSGRKQSVRIVENARLNNRDKSIGARLSIDIERWLNHELTAAEADQLPAVLIDGRGRRFLQDNSVDIASHGSAGQSFGAFCNDGMRLLHQGTCNDGVGKGASGGTIVVQSPGGGSREPAGNVLVGNFALFGATGGRLFVEGQGGDRFAVRNSGASAVVEGVGDFCCEYMTAGAVLNLGSFGKGFGNGMSGGFAYQYDPEKTLSQKASLDSVRLLSLSPDGPDVDFHEEAIRRMLELHYEATGSEIAKDLLSDWDTSVGNFVCVMPTALLQYQDRAEILKATSRKDLADELATAVATSRLRAFKLAYRDGQILGGGRTPVPGSGDTADAFELLNNYVVLALAQKLAMARAPGEMNPTSESVHAVVRKLLLTEDFALMQTIKKYAATSITAYTDDELATLIADKRLCDYKRALCQRDARSLDNFGTDGWILWQTAQNRAAFGEIPSHEELFARATAADVTTFATAIA
ncbi:MAG: glutamate synthase-related protein [Pseudomonadota bacterium]